MFRNLKRKPKKISIEKKVKNNFFSSCPTFVFDQKIVYKQFFVKNKTRVTRENLIFNDFFNFNNSHVFLVKVLDIILADKNRNMHIFYKKKFQS